MSRRDEAVESLTSALSTILAAALPTAPPHSNGGPPTRAERITTVIGGIVDLPGNQVAPSPPLPSRQPAGSYDLNAVAHDFIPDETGEIERIEGDDLPAYTRRPHSATNGNGGAVSSLPPKLHTYTSKSKKVRMSVLAPGVEAIVLIAPPAGNVTLAGDLTLNLPNPEPITHVKIRIKGLVRTVVLKMNGSGRHPVVDEVVFWEDSRELYTDGAFLAANESNDPLKLQGTFSFPFSLHLPPNIPRVSAATGEVRKYRLPPSFVLNASSGINGGSDEWASVRYFVKVTVGRKGMLKQNERLIAPLVFLPRAPHPECSPARMLALAHGTPPPTPEEDPLGWKGKKVRQHIKRGLFTGRRAWFEVTLLLPVTKFSRSTCVPFVVKISSSDPSATTTFPLSACTVMLIQRSFVQAQGLAGTHDLIAAKGILEHDGPADGTEIPLSSIPETEGSDAPAVWSRQYKGEIKLGPNVGSSFRAPNLILTFLVAIRVACPGTGNDLEFHCPCEIISPFRTGGDVGGYYVAPPPIVDVVEEVELVLPPSYFQSTERD